MATVTKGEAPGGYNYHKHSGGGHAHSGAGHLDVSAVSSSGTYQKEAIGVSTNEGAQVDTQLLELIRQVLLKEESHASLSGAGGHHGGAPATSSSYGVPSPSYGVPSVVSGPSARVVEIILENAIPAIQVAQYHSESAGQAESVSSGFEGYSSGPSISEVSAPSPTYVAPAVAPSSSYGAPASEISSSLLRSLV